MWVGSLGWEDPWRRAWQPPLVFLPEESHGQRGLVGFGPEGCKESDVTEGTQQQQERRVEGWICLEWGALRATVYQIMSTMVLVIVRDLGWQLEVNNLTKSTSLSLIDLKIPCLQTCFNSSL